MPAQRATLWHEVHGRGGPVLVLLHGLGATAEVWRGVADLAGGWPGTRLLVDLPGHGRSAPLPAYSYQAHASAVAALLGGRPGPVVVAGHSMGGYVGLLLAGRRDGPAVAAVVGLGIKVRWSAEELEGLRRRAGQPVRWFDGRQEAAARYLRSVGLDGLVEPASPLVDSGIAGSGGRWRLAFDPAASGLGAPDMAAALAAHGRPWCWPAAPATRWWQPPTWPRSTTTCASWPGSATTPTSRTRPGSGSWSPPRPATQGSGRRVSRCPRGAWGRAGTGRPGPRPGWC
jgi:pimeloyl-ACP methyl ester carboxylesterase